MPPENPDPARPSTLGRSKWYFEEVHAHAPRLRAYLRTPFPQLGEVDDGMQESCRTLLPSDGGRRAPPRTVSLTNRKSF